MLLYFRGASAQDMQAIASHTASCILRACPAVRVWDPRTGVAAFLSCDAHVGWGG